MGNDTSDPAKARIHARAMAGKVVETMPSIPPKDVKNLPAGVSQDDVIWSEMIAPGGYAWRKLRRGTRLQLTDLYGDACVSMLLFNATTPSERLNVADTIKVQWSAYLSSGKLLLSDMGRVLASIVSDEAGTHDCFCGPSTPASMLRMRGSQSVSADRSTAKQRLVLGAAKLGLGPKDVHPCINLFKGVRIADNGAITLDVGPYPPGRSVVLRSEMDIMLVLANCAHVLDRRTDSATPLRILAWRGPITPEDDDIRRATPEGLRAFLNTEDYYRL